MTHTPTQLVIRVPRPLLQTFVERCSRQRPTEGLLQRAVEHIGNLLLATAAAVVPFESSLEGFRSVLNFAAQDVARDVRAGCTEAALSEFGQVVTAAVSIHNFPRRIRPKVSREIALTFDFDS